MAGTQERHPDAATHPAFSSSSPHIDVTPTATEMSKRAALRAIEFFSGIGGYHAATQVAGLPIRVVSAFDINTEANRVYNFNFGRDAAQQHHSAQHHHHPLAASQHAGVHGDLSLAGPHKPHHAPAWPVSLDSLASHPSGSAAASSDGRSPTTKPTASTREYSTAQAGVKASTESIENLSLSKLDGASDIWMMSPPCQPFTRAGAKRDHTDNRTKPFLHLLDTLRRMLSPPSYVVLENVKGFETSVSHGLLMETLRNRQYTVHEFILTPTQFGLPNERVRYYCVATRNPITNPSKSSDLKKNLQELFDCVANPGAPSTTALSSIAAATAEQEQGQGQDHTAAGPSAAPSSASAQSHILNYIPGSEYFATPQTMFQPKYLSEFLDVSANDAEEFKVPDSYLDHPGYKFDMVTPCHTTSSCFTKAYGKNYRGSGPLILLGGQHIPAEEPLDLAKHVDESADPAAWASNVCTRIDKEHPSLDTSATAKRKSEAVLDDDEEDHEIAVDSLLQGPTGSLPRYSVYRGQQLRFFSPHETLRLMGFPAWYNFPPKTTPRQAYPLLGNSLNVLVVSELLKFMLREHQ